MPTARKLAAALMFCHRDSRLRNRWTYYLSVITFGFRPAVRRAAACLSSAAFSAFRVFSSRFTKREGLTQGGGARIGSAFCDSMKRDISLALHLSLLLGGENGKGIPRPVFLRSHSNLRTEEVDSSSRLATSSIKISSSASFIFLLLFCPAIWQAFAAFVVSLELALPLG